MANLDPLSRPDYEPEVSGLRGLAVLIAVGGHFVQRIDRFNPAGVNQDERARLFVDFFSASAAGVYLFFAVSGYLIAQRVGRMRDFGANDLTEFYLRRFLRIAPPYYVLLVSTWLVLEVFRWEPPSTKLYNVAPASLTESLVASLGYVHGLTYGTYPRLFPPGWTLEVEVQFYALSPFLCLAFQRASARLGLAAASVLALAASATVALAALRSGIDRLQPTLLVYLPLFVAGIIACHVRRSGWRPASRFVPGLGWLGLAGFVTLQPLVTALGVELAARIALIALMFAAVAAEHGSFYRLCTHPVLVRIGVVSYSIYLIHLQIMHMATYAASRTFGTMSFWPALIANGLLAAPMLYLATKVFFKRIERPSFFLAHRTVGHARRFLRSGTP